jgi:hypothetical protein
MDKSVRICPWRGWFVSAALGGAAPKLACYAPQISLNCVATKRSYGTASLISPMPIANLFKPSTASRAMEA